MMDDLMMLLFNGATSGSFLVARDVAKKGQDK
jgi:hypothetical protein